MKVYYMNGAGNDFMVIDARGLTLDYPALARKCCAITGADGFMATDVSDKADFRLHFYNSDGTRGEMCGNGARCICRFGHDIGLAGDVMTVETDAGLVPGWRLDENLYRVKLNNPYVLDLHRKGDVAYLELGHPGVPHAVAEYKGDLWADADKLLETFRALRFDPAFPKGGKREFLSTAGGRGDPHSDLRAGRGGLHPRLRHRLRLRGLGAVEEGASSRRRSHRPQHGRHAENHH